MGPLVSIVLPVYNAEKYLLECLISISNQSYKYLEIILIDDGSSDGSIDIIKDYSKSESRAITLRQENKGVASARDKGLQLASGKYVIHCDADDFFETNAIELLVDCAERNNSDVVIAGYFVKYKNRAVEVRPDFSDGCSVDKLLKGSLHGALWNKLIKRELVVNLFFEPEINYMEDYLFLFRALSSREDINISYLVSPVYNYRMREGSYTNLISMSSLSDASKVVSLIEREAGKGVSSHALRIMRANNIYRNLMNDPTYSRFNGRLDCLRELRCLNLGVGKLFFVVLSVYGISFPTSIVKFFKRALYKPY